MRAYAVCEKNWKQFLPEISIRINSTTGDATEEAPEITPAMLMFGRELIPKFTEEIEDDEALNQSFIICEENRKRQNERLKVFEQIWNDRREQGRERCIKKVTRRISPETGDIVFVWKPPKTKWDYPWKDGPYVVKERIGPTCILDDGGPPQHIRNLKIIQPRTNENNNTESERRKVSEEHKFDKAQKDINDTNTAPKEITRTTRSGRTCKTPLRYKQDKPN